MARSISQDLQTLLFFEDQERRICHLLEGRIIANHSRCKGRFVCGVHGGVAVEMIRKDSGVMIDTENTGRAITTALDDRRVLIASLTASSGHAEGASNYEGGNIAAV